MKKNFFCSRLLNCYEASVASQFVHRSVMLWSNEKTNMLNLK